MPCIRMPEGVGGSFSPPNMVFSRSICIVSTPTPAPLEERLSAGQVGLSGREDSGAGHVGAGDVGGLGVGASHIVDAVGVRVGANGVGPRIQTADSLICSDHMALVVARGGVSR